MSRLFALDHAADTDDWYTPQWVFDGMGGVFDLDVAAPPGGCDWIPARRHYSIEDDGLNMPWDGFVWCNPPYSNTRPWCLRWAEHANGILLVPADLSSSGQLAAFGAASSMFVPRGRLRFVNGHGAAASSPNFTAVLLGAGEAADAALSRLRRFGVCRQLWASGEGETP